LANECVLSCRHILSCVELYLQQKVAVEDDIDFAISVVSLFSSTSRLVSATNILIYLQQLLFIDSRGFCATRFDNARLGKYQSLRCTIHVCCCTGCLFCDGVLVMTLVSWQVVSSMCVSVTKQCNWVFDDALWLVINCGSGGMDQPNTLPTQHTRPSDILYL